jgi:DNA-binding NtrC family response regulator
LRDLGSRNGTYLNGQRVEHAVIQAGDVLTIGETVGIVTQRAPAWEGIRFGEVASGLWAGAELAPLLASLPTLSVSDVPVVLIGETGTGKDRFARAIHELSGRRGAFHAVNCSALPPSLAESELFGHLRGAFTGAGGSNVGHLRAAHEGTLFLDEVADLHASVQAKLLRAIEEHAVMPLGGTALVAADARIIVAAHEPLEAIVARQGMRQDLFARLSGFRLDIPPLRARRSEIPGLVFHFLAKHGLSRPPAVEPKLLERLCLYDWPGNVRELELLLRKLLILHAQEPVLRRRFSVGLLPERPPMDVHAGAQASGRQSSRGEHDLRLLKAALAKSGGNMSRAAEMAGVSRRRAYRLLAKTGTGGEPAVEFSGSLGPEREG